MGLASAPLFGQDGGHALQIAFDNSFTVPAMPKTPYEQTCPARYGRYIALR